MRLLPSSWRGERSQVLQKEKDDRRLPWDAEQVYALVRTTDLPPWNYGGPCHEKVNPAACYHHQADWKAIADAAARIVREVGQSGPRDRYTAAISATLVPRAEKGWLYSLFTDPIDIGSGKSYTNGQHRACAIKASGAEFAVVTLYVQP